MKRLFNIFSIFCIIATAICLSACSNDDHDLQVPEQNGEWIAVPLQFNPAADSRAAIDIENGDMLLLSLSTDTENVMGYATFSKDTYSWTAYLKSEPDACTNKHCSVVYINNNPTMNNDEGFVALTPHNATLKGEGTFSYGDKGLIVDSRVIPDTGRIRFKGSNQTGYQFRGVIAKDRYNFAQEGIVYRYDFDNALSYSNYNIDFTEQDGEYLSDYFYVIRSADGCSYLHMKNGNTTYLLTKQLKTFLDVGSSATITMPEEDNRSLWVSDTYAETKPNITLFSKSSGSGWSDYYYLNSLSGAVVDIDYEITYCAASSDNSVIFQVRIYAYDKDGNKLGSVTQSITKEEVNIDEQSRIYLDFYYPDATQYEVDLYGYYVKATIHSFTISNY